MKKMFAAVAITAILVVAYFIYLGQVSRSGSAPGLVSGMLSSCPDKPNCVCSENRQDDAHFIEPLPLAGAPLAQAMQNLRAAVEQLGGHIESSSADYIAASFRSSLFGFVDDVEFRADQTRQVIQVRSASRVGHSDLGANRKRVESIRQQLTVTPGVSRSDEG